MPTPESIGDTADQAIDRALGQRPDLMQQVAEIRSANAKVKEAKAAYYPELSLTASPSVPSLYGIQSPYPWAHTADLTGGLSFNLRWTVFDGGARKNRLAEARANVHAAEAQANVKRNQIADEVWTAYSNLNTAFRQRQAAVALARIGQSVLQRGSRIVQLRCAQLAGCNRGSAHSWHKPAQPMCWRERKCSLRSQSWRSEPEIRFAPTGGLGHECDPWICMRCVRAYSAAADGLRTGSIVRHSRLVLSRVARLSCGLPLC